MYSVLIITHVSCAYGDVICHSMSTWWSEVRHYMPNTCWFELASRLLCLLLLLDYQLAVCEECGQLVLRLLYISVSFDLLVCALL